MIDILFYVPSVSYGGGETYIVNLVSELQKKDRKKIFVLTGCKEICKKLENVDCEVKVVKTSPKLGFKLALGLFYLNSEISKLKPKIVFLNGLPEAGALAKYIKSYGADLISIGHSNEFWIRDEKKFTLKGVIKKLVYLNFTKYLDKIIVITEESKKSVMSLPLYSCSVKKIYNGCPEIYIEGKKQSNKLSFGRISRLCPGKGNEMLLEAFGRVVRNNPNLNLELVFAGIGEQMDTLISLCAKFEISDCVRFIGHVSPTEFFSQIDCMISSSDMEALPTVISEAMSCKVPVIATEVGGVSEMLVHKHTGYLIPPKSVDDMVDAMSEFINKKSDFSSYSENAYLDYQKRFSLQSSVNLTWEFIYEQD